jgi:hypothetical protein
MRQILSLLIFCTTFSLLAQEKDTTTYSFSVNQKVILEIIQIDSVNLKYHVVDIQQIEPGLDYSETDTLFKDEPVKNTLVFYFAEGIDQGGPFKTVLILRNNTDFMISYKLAITDDPSEGFYMTSVTPLFPNVISSELWNDNLKALVPHKLTIEE